MRYKAFIVIAFGLLTSACSLDYTIEDLEAEPVFPVQKPFAGETEFTAGEVVTTNNGVVIKASFSDVTEHVHLESGVTIEGVLTF